MRKLSVIAEVFIDKTIHKTVNRSFNEILLSYSRYFDQIHYIGPGQEEVTLIPGIGENIRLSTMASYAKPLRHRLAYYIKYHSVKRRFRALLEVSSANIVQIRIPSLFSMAAYPVVRELNLPLTVYIAGNWLTSFTTNYSFIGNQLIGRILENLQRPIIKHSILVTAGPLMTKQYANIATCHPYLSTTHRGVFNKPLAFPPKKLLFVGRLEPLKRVEDAIVAVNLLKIHGIDVTLSVVGDGKLRGQLEKLVIDQKLTDRVFFKGYISDAEKLKNEYLNADILVLPSLSEGSPKVVAEAMAHGTLPIAVAGTGSNNFIIRDGKNGFLTPGKSPEAIAETIQVLRGSRELCQKIISNAYQYAEEHTLDREVDKLWEFVFSNI